DMSSGFTPDELPPQIERLETHRLEVWNMIQDMVNSHADIAELGAPAMLPKPPGVKLHADLGAKTRGYMEGLRAERDALTLTVRNSAMNYDRNYMSALEEMQVVERDLHNIKRLKMALELARDSVMRASTLDISEWPRELSKLSLQMLENMGLNYEDLFSEHDARASDRDREQRPISQEVEHLSVITKEQLFWLAHVLIAKFVSRDNLLPLVLDEPFANISDWHFFRIVQFLFDMVDRGHQVIVCSWHEERIQILLKNLTDAQKARLHVCKRMPMNAVSAR
ncbi:MAG TPA: hypothetical protein V6C72_12480, partial [Chroococcales cyanobacterium]